MRCYFLLDRLLGFFFAQQVDRRRIKSEGGGVLEGRIWVGVFIGGGEQSLSSNNWRKSVVVPYTSLIPKKVRSWSSIYV